MFGEGVDNESSAEPPETVSTTNIKSIAFDRGYYSQDNQDFLEANGIEEIYLPYRRRDDSRTTDLDSETQVKLHCRRSGIEPIIGHIKHGGQLRRSRMKSNNTTLAAGYSAVLGFNLRQLKRAAIGKIRPIFGTEAKMVA